MTDFETIVVGNGLIGSAAARYLSEIGKDVAIIGQEEPNDPATHDGVFASHYDQRRLTHIAGRAAYWIEAKREAIAEYATLEQQSGIQFHDPVGYLMVIPPHLSNCTDAPQRLANELNIPHTFYSDDDNSWHDQFPEYHFPDSHAVLHEPAPAGTIDPRAMRQAQNVVAQANGTVIIPALVTDVRQQQGVMMVHARDGRLYRAKKVLLATGAFTNSYHLLSQKLALTPKTEAVILGEVSAADGAQLSQLPSLSFDIDTPQISECYMTPATRDENGRYYIKLGANSIHDQFSDDLTEIQTWFQAGDSDALLPALRRALTTIMPTTHFLSFQTKRCIITRTTSDYPMIDQVADGLFVAVGGNGGSAQCASSWGKIAAGLVENGRWSSPIPQSFFRVVFK